MQPIPLTADQEQMRLVDQKGKIENNFTYHAPKEGQPEKYVALREKAKEFALLIVELTPYSREQSLAIIELEMAVFWANAAIARNEQHEQTEEKGIVKPVEQMS